MGCDKRYGPRDVWVTAEASPNTPGVYTEDNYLQRCTGSNFPAVYRENLDNGEATGNRGQSQAFDGAQNELSWDVTVMVPDNDTIGDPSGWPASLQALFWAAGFGQDAGPSSWEAAHSGDTVTDIQANSACGRTIQLLGLDRDKRQLELLTGAVVSQVVFNFSRTDVCTVQFSGVAAQKWEATAPTITSADEGNTVATAICRGSFNATLPSSPAHLTGVSVAVGSTTTALYSINPSGGQITVGTAFPLVSTATPTTFSVAKPAAAYYDVLSPDAWSLGGLASVQSATVTIETGQGYGELTTAAQYPTELISGQVKVSASATAYLVDNNLGLPTFDTGAPLYIYFAPNMSGYAIKLASAKFTERPAIDLSSVDDAASGDFSFAAGETGTLLSDNALDTFLIV